MARFPFPYLHYRDVVQFGARHEAEEFMADYQRAGHIRRCQHVDVVPRMAGEGYFVDCARDAFVRQERPFVGGNFPRFDFHGCPRPCRHYASVRRVWARRWLRAVGHIIWTTPVGFLGWLFGPAISRALLVLMVFAVALAALPSSWRSEILGVLKPLTDALKALKDSALK